MENNMSDSTNSDAAQGSPSAYDELLTACRAGMIRLFPAHATVIQSGSRAINHMEGSFLMDALSEKGKHNFPHHLSDERLRQEIGSNPAEIFEGLSESMLNFYGDKLAALKQ
jgi:hypothetical protein